VKVRIIPTVLVNGNTVVKGKNFNSWRTVGHVNSVARLLAERDVDEIIFLDTRATLEERNVNSEFIKNFAEAVNIPFGVGGGIRSVDQAKEYIRNGCEKVVLGDILFEQPELVAGLASEIGSQAVVASIDVGNDMKLYRKSGKIETKEELVPFLRFLEELGIGEILIQSISREGTMLGYDTDVISRCVQAVNVPVLASGGAGRMEDFFSAAKVGASGVCSGAFFQFTEFTPHDVRKYLKSQGIQVRN
jgi:cyclase